MFINGTADQIARLIPTVWSPLMYQELRHKPSYINIFARDYEGEIKEKGNTVKVSQVKKPTGQILLDDKEQFETEELQVGGFDIVADRRAVSSFEITDLAKLQSLEFQLEVTNALVDAILEQMETDVMSIMVAAAANQIGALAGASFDLADVVALRNALRAKKVPISDVFLALGSTYYGSLLTKNMVMSSDYGSINDLMGGEVKKLSGFATFENIMENATSAVAFHKSAVQLVSQTQVNVKVSDLHANKKFGYLVSADIVYGRKLADENRIATLKL